MSASPKTVFSRVAPIAVGLVLLLSLTVVQGLWSQRWSDDNERVEARAARIEQVSMEAGDWKGEPQKSNPNILRQAGAIGATSRAYRNDKTGEVVSIFIICGHSRDTAVHTPNICYPRAGYTQLEKPATKYSFDAEIENEFYTATFRAKDQDGGGIVRVFWGWATDPKWVAPDGAKSSFPGETGLVKMYFITALPNENQPPEDSPANAFAKDFLPIVTRTLFPPAEYGEGKPADSNEKTAASR